MKNRQDLPLTHDIAARFLPIIVGLMVYLGCLCCVFTFFVFDATHSWKKQLTTHVTIEIPRLPSESSDTLQARVLQLLNKTPGIRQAAAVPQRELESLLTSLVGTTSSMDLPSLPVLIDVALTEEEPIDIENLEAHLKNMDAQIQLMDHRAWQAQVLTLIQATIVLTSTLTLLVLLTALIATKFAVRTSLLIHRHVIDILHLIGATDEYIARQFQIHILKQGLVASTLGAALAFLTFWGIMFLLENIGFSFAFKATFFVQAFCVFTLAPFMTSFFMMFFARHTALKGLYT
jgi:cell division transport system permease protein